MERMKAGQGIIELLLAEGVEYTFGLVGLTTNSIVTEMYDRSDIKFVDTRHEEGAAFMAYGYTKATGRPAACITTSGPGTINLITGVSLAYKGRAPVVVISGDTARDFVGRDGTQAFDLVSLFKPITNWATQVNKTERIPEAFRNAFRVALTPPQGPVFVNIPRDLMDDLEVDWDIQPPESYRAVNTRTPGDAEAVRRAADLLANAERPLLLAGGGVIESGATDEAGAAGRNARHGARAVLRPPRLRAEQPPAVRWPARRARFRRGRAGGTSRGRRACARLPAQPADDRLEQQRHSPGNDHSAGGLRPAADWP